MWILVLALFAVILWFVLRRPGGSAVAMSALNSVSDADALVVSAWRKLDAMIDATADPDLTCARMMALRKSDLPTEIVEHWQYIDDLTERSNRRAEHYETVSRQPAPPLVGRSVSETIMAGIRRRAARAESVKKAEDEKAPAVASKARIKSDVPKGFLSPEHATERLLLPEVREAYDGAKKLMAARFGDDQAIAGKDLLKLAEETTGLTKLALELMALYGGVVGGGISRDSAIAMLREQQAHFKSLREMGQEDAKSVVDPTLELFELFLPVLEQYGEKGSS